MSIAGKILGPCERVVGHICGRGTGGCGQIMCAATATRLYKGHPVCEPCEDFLIETAREQAERKADEDSRPKTKMERLVRQAEALNDKLKSEQSARPKRSRREAT